MLRSVVMVVGSLDRRMSAIEASVASMNRRMAGGRSRTALPDSEALKIAESPTTPSASVAHDREHEGSVSSTPNAPAETIGPLHFLRNSPVSSIPTSFPSVVKSHSAIADRGYTTKASLWGSCLASLLVACMRRYILKTGESMHVIDESILISTYREVVGDLYRKIKFTDLPAVSRPDRNTLTTSTARDWLDISKHADGVEAMAVIESMILAAKMVPEAMIHPISKVVEQIRIPIVMENNKKEAVFSIPKGDRDPDDARPVRELLQDLQAEGAQDVRHEQARGRERERGPLRVDQDDEGVGDVRPEQRAFPNPILTLQSFWELSRLTSWLMHGGLKAWKSLNKGRYLPAL